MGNPRGWTWGKVIFVNDEPQADDLNLYSIGVHDSSVAFDCIFLVSTAPPQSWYFTGSLYGILLTKLKTGVMIYARQPGQTGKW